MNIHILPFEPSMLSQAGELLAQRHARDRAAMPVLPQRYCDPEVAQKAVKTSFEREHACGFAAMDGDRMAAYLIGQKTIDSTWGRSGWVRAAACAYDPTTGVEVVRDLYAALGESWVKDGIFAHFALIPVTDTELVQAWFSLSFGIEQVHALADLAELRPQMPEVPPGVTIRRAGPDDRQALAAMSDVIWRQQVQAPVWAAMMPESVQETPENWASLVDEADVTVLLAWMDGQVVGIQGYWPSETALGASNDQVYIPETCAHMSVAGTRPQARGKGIGTLLSRMALAMMREEGYSTCDTDWRSANLLASRFWPKMGYRPAVYRLARRVDERIAWAKGEL